MQTPNTRAGRLTEKIMAKVNEKLPNIQTDEYNRTYEAVLEVLRIEMPEMPGLDDNVVRYPHGGGMFINRRKG